MEFKTQPGEKDLKELALAQSVASPLFFGPKKMWRSIVWALLYAVVFGALFAVCWFLVPVNSTLRQVVFVIAMVSGVVIVVLIGARAVQFSLAGRRAKEKGAPVAGRIRVNGKGVVFLPEGDGKEVSLKWQQIEKVLVTGRLYAFIGGEGAVVFFTKKDLGSRAGALEKYIEDKMGGKGKQVLRDE